VTSTVGPDATGYSSRVRGCLLGGAIGDALGAPIEFLSIEGILAQVGEHGVREYLPVSFGDVSGHGLVTDDTQMTLFVTEGIIRARVREDRGLGFTTAVTDHALRRWLDTQEHPAPTGRRDGWLQGERWLYSRRAPGTTCLTALRDADPDRFGAAAVNDSKGCGGVMRSAPFGLLRGFSSSAVYEFAVLSAGYTHGHPTGQHAGGALAHLVHRLVDGDGLDAALASTRRHLASQPAAHGVAVALDAAVHLARGRPGDRQALATLGQGWVAEEAFAIAVYAALSHPGAGEVLDALSLAVTHSGDSDSTGSITGNIVGALHGVESLPAVLLFEVEGRGTMLQLADDMVLENTAGAQLHGDYGPITRWTRRYPGW
jgi:ADP-ribosylglycohydrolase